MAKKMPPETSAKPEEELTAWEYHDGVTNERLLVGELPDLSGLRFHIGPSDPAKSVMVGRTVDLEESAVQALHELMGQWIADRAKEYPGG